MLKHDEKGFLSGEPVPDQRKKADEEPGPRGDVFATLRDIRNDVRSMARFMAARGGAPKAAQPAGRRSAAATTTANDAASARAQAASMRSRDAAGRFVAAPRAVTVKRSARERQQADTVRTHAVATVAPTAKPTLNDRDGRGRFTGNGRKPDEAGKVGKGKGKGGEGGGAGGGGGGGNDPYEEPGGGFGEKLADRLSGLKTAVEGMGAGASQMDPAVAALNEVKDVVAPFGRGIFAMFGRTAEKKKERWYTRILDAIRGKKHEDPKATLSVGGEGGGMLSGIGRLLPLILTGLGAVLAGGLGLFLGTKLGGAIYDWLDKSGIATKIFDAFDALKAWIEDKVQTVKNMADDFTTQKALAREGLGGTGTVLDNSGRNLNDPRRLDVKPAEGVSGKVGRFIGDIQRGRDAANKDAARTAAENRAEVTGRTYRAGNIAGLDDAHTRALVASTAATESGGGKLGIVNGAGYMGRYQAGAGWLADAGLIKGGAGAVKAAMTADGFTNEYQWGKAGGMTKFLKNDANWNGNMSYRGFLGSAQAQDGAFKTNSDKAYAEMVRKGVITPGMPQEQVAGLLKARHIAGMGGAEAVAAGGTGPADANGTTARKYFDDVTSDRGGFLATYSANAATAGVQRVQPVSIPSPVPQKIPEAQAVEMPVPPGPEKDKIVRAVVREPIGQDVGDRKIAHIVSGGIGG